MNTRVMMGHALAAIAASAVGTVLATDRYVSSGGDWTMPDAGDQPACYTVLADALAAAGEGDTVWLQDGFVADTGAATLSKYDNKNVRAYLEDKNLTLRSESGFVDEAAGKGATIRGRYHDAAAGVTNGADAVSGVFGALAGQRVVGLIIENCATPSSGSSVGGTDGGGICSRSDMVVENCVIRNCACARNGGGVFANSELPRFVNCVITNNYAGQYGGGGYGACYYDSTIGWNGSVNSGGGLFDCAKDLVHVVSNCLVTCNRVLTEEDEGSAYLGGGIAYARSPRSLIIDSRIVGNVSRRNGGGVYASGTLVRCRVSGNVCGGAKGYGGGVCGYHGAKTYDASMLRVYDCVISNNAGSVSGGGAYFAIISGSTISDNVCTNNTASSQAEGVNGGGGVSACIVSNSVICGNTTYFGGGGAHASWVVGCVISNNSSSCSATGGASGTSVCGGVYVTGRTAFTPYSTLFPFTSETRIENCLIVGNWTANQGSGGITVDNQLHDAGDKAADWKNCTAGVNCRIVNTLVAGNFAGTRGGVCAVQAVNEEAGASTALPTFVNCTIADNGMLSGVVNRFTSSAKNVRLVNSIVWNNTNDTYNVFGSAQNSCAVTLSDTTSYPGCVCTNPKFRGGLGAEAYGLKANSLCRNGGVAFGWMRDPEDVRSRDLAGRPRITGDTPSMGAYEYSSVGLILLLR